MSSQYLNKALAAILLAALIAMLTSFIARHLVPTETELTTVHYPFPESASEPAPEDTKTEPDQPPSIATLLASADPDRGSQQFRPCQACHSATKGGSHKVGPNLWNIVMADIAHHDDFNYSNALSSLDGQWTYERLNQFIANPSGYASGTRMTYAGLRDAEDRADLIAWLRQQNDDPPPLPDAAAADGATETQADSGDGGAATEPAESDQMAAGETGSEQSQAADTGAADTGAAGTGASETAASDTAATETGASETAESDTAATETGASETAASDTAATETGASETAASDTAATETGASETVVAGSSGAAGAEAAPEPATEASQVGESAAPSESTGTEGTGSPGTDTQLAQAEGPQDGAQESAQESASSAGGSSSGGESMSALEQRLVSADVEAGEAASRACRACHTFDQGGRNRIGPNLWNVVMSDIARRDDFRYSNAVSSLGGKWTYARLDEYLTDPRSYAPGTRMTFAGVKDDQDRANLIAWLRTLSEDPAPLP